MSLSLLLVQLISLGALGKGFLNGHEPNEILVHAVDIIENLSTLSELDLPRSRHEQEASTLGCVI